VNRTRVSLRSQPALDQASSLSLTMGLTTILGLSTEIRLSTKSLFLRKIVRLRTSVDALPMSGDQGVVSLISWNMRLPEPVEGGRAICVSGLTARPAGNGVGECESFVDEGSGYGQADDEAGGQAGRIPGAGEASS
jgi:hypothetical protein